MSAKPTFKTVQNPSSQNCRKAESLLKGQAQDALWFKWKYRSTVECLGVGSNPTSVFNVYKIYRMEC